MQFIAINPLKSWTERDVNNKLVTREIGKLDLSYFKFYNFFSNFMSYRHVFIVGKILNNLKPVTKMYLIYSTGGPRYPGSFYLRILRDGSMYLE